MLDAAARLARIARAMTHKSVEDIEKMVRDNTSFLSDKLDAWEKDLGIDDDDYSTRSQDKSSYWHNEKAQAEEAKRQYQEQQKQYQEQQKKYQEQQRRQYQQQNQSHSSSQQNSGVSKIVEDLNLFGLSLPGNLSEVKKVRNREMKKYHPDLFHGDPAKLKTAEQIMQIYNNAFERLKKHYGK